MVEEKEIFGVVHTAFGDFPCLWKMPRMRHGIELYDFLVVNRDNEVTHIHLPATGWMFEEYTFPLVLGGLKTVDEDKRRENEEVVYE